MCLLVMASRIDKTAPLVVGANRDERLERPSTAMGVLQLGGPRILGGRDEEAGGTWLAVNEHGVVAALTNRPAREGRDPSRRSRGELPLALALHAKAPDAVADFVHRFRPGDYNPAWILVGDRRSLYAIDMTGERPAARELPPGVHILENVPFEASSPKADNVRLMLGRVGHGGVEGDALTSRLKRVLADHSLPEGLEVGERAPETQAACVHTENYGTRSSTLVRVPSSEDAPVVLSVADGHPCEAPYIDATNLWSP